MTGGSLHLVTYHFDGVEKELERGPGDIGKIVLVFAAR